VRRELVLPGPPMPLRLSFAWQHSRPQILPRCLDVHTDLRGGDLLRLFRVRQSKQPPYLLVRDHLEPTPPRPSPSQSPSPPSSRAISQSERDWAYAKRALRRGHPAAEVIREIAAHRRDDKSDRNITPAIRLKRHQGQSQLEGLPHSGDRHRSISRKLHGRFGVRSACISSFAETEPSSVPTRPSKLGSVLPIRMCHRPGSRIIRENAQSSRTTVRRLTSEQSVGTDTFLTGDRRSPRIQSHMTI
jgi:hypothetical protein